jgi:hypothetical protein
MKSNMTCPPPPPDRPIIAVSTQVKENEVARIYRMNAGRKLERKRWALGGICPLLPTLDFWKMSTFKKNESYQILIDLSEMKVKN